MTTRWIKSNSDRGGGRVRARNCFVRDPRSVWMAYSAAQWDWTEGKAAWNSLRWTHTDRHTNAHIRRADAYTQTHTRTADAAVAVAAVQLSPLHFSFEKNLALASLFYCVSLLPQRTTVRLSDTESVLRSQLKSNSNYYSLRQFINSVPL